MSDLLSICHLILKQQSPQIALSPTRERTCLLAHGMWHGWLAGKLFPPRSGIDTQAFSCSCKPPDRWAVASTERHLTATDATRASMQCVVAEAELNQGEYSTVQARGAVFQISATSRPLAEVGTAAEWVEGNHHRRYGGSPPMTTTGERRASEALSGQIVGGSASRATSRLC